MITGNQRNGFVHIVVIKRNVIMKSSLEFIKEWGLLFVPFIALGAFWLFITFTNVLY